MFDYIEPTGKEIENFLKEADKNYDGQIDFNEFSQFVVMAKERLKIIVDIFRQYALPPPKDTSITQRHPGISIDQKQ